MKARTFHDLAHRCVEIGRERTRLAAWRLHRLSREAMRQHAAKVAGVSLEELEKLSAEVATFPYLDRLIAELVAGWRRGGGRGVLLPGRHGAFADGDRYGPAYSERIAGAFTVELCSGVAILRLAQVGDDGEFGDAEDPGAADAEIDALNRELDQLGRELPQAPVALSTFNQAFVGGLVQLTVDGVQTSVWPIDSLAHRLADLAGQSHRLAA